MRWAGNPCDYCRSLGKTEWHVPACPDYDKEYYNMPNSAVNSGAMVSIGWTLKTSGNSTNDWIDRFFKYLTEIDSDTNMLYTSFEAYTIANSKITSGEANTAQFYGNTNFRLSDVS